MSPEDKDMEGVVNDDGEDDLDEDRHGHKVVALVVLGVLLEVACALDNDVIL